MMCRCEFDLICSCFLDVSLLHRLHILTSQRTQNMDKDFSVAFQHAEKLESDFDTAPTARTPLPSEDLADTNIPI